VSQFLLLTFGLKVDLLAPSYPRRDRSTLLATKFKRIRRELPANESIPAIDTKPLPAPLLRIEPLPEPEAPRSTRVAWIAAGVMVLFGLVIGGNYWLSQRDRPHTEVSPAPLVKPVPAVAERSPGADPPPQLITGLRPLSSQPTPDRTATTPPAEPSQAPSPDQINQPVEQAPASAAARSRVFAPSESPHATEDRAPLYVTIGEGQTLIRIAHANHVSAAEIAAANHLESPFQLKAGSRLLIPDPHPPTH
jgi:LysM repeat protein